MYNKYRLSTDAKQKLTGQVEFMANEHLLEPIAGAKCILVTSLLHLHLLNGMRFFEFEMGRKFLLLIVWEGKGKEKILFLVWEGKWEGQNEFSQCGKEMGRKY